MNYNGAVEGGGIYVTATGTVEVKTDNSVFQNFATDNGGGIYNLGVVHLRESSEVAENYAPNGAGVYNDGFLHIFNSARIHENAAEHDGGGVYNTTHATLRIEDSTARIEENVAAYVNGSGAGGGVANHGAGVVDVLSGEIVNYTPDDLHQFP